MARPASPRSAGAALSSPPAASGTRADWILPAMPQEVDPLSPPPSSPAYPPPAYPPPGYQRQPYEPPAGGQRTVEQPGLQPYGPYQLPPGGPPPGPPRQPPRRHDRNRSGSSLALWILLPLLLIGGGAALLLAHPFSHPGAHETANAGTGPASPSGRGGTASAGPAASGNGSASPATAAPSSAPVTEQQAAASVATMLSQSFSDRTAISSAAADVDDCGPRLAADPKVFETAASSRRTLLARLATMPGRAVLPAALLSDLTQAWQASAAADQAYARWADDEIAHGCRVNDTSDPGYQAAEIPDRDATKDKTAFAAAWNPVAARFGLTRYQPGQL